MNKLNCMAILTINNKCYYEDHFHLINVRNSITLHVYQSIK